jgi:poly(hydroxyalkanoate) depolymerase family esterase
MSSALREAMRLMQTGDLRAATAEIQRGLGAAPAPAPPAAASAASEPLEGVFDVLDETLQRAPEPGTSIPPGQADAPLPQASFTEHVYSGPAGKRRYKLFVPAAYRGQPLPLVVMLHGCTQSPDDFATGTRMNVAAEASGCFVVYPAQSQQANASKCWNWFKPGDQSRDQGEPAIIAGLVAELSLTWRLDRERICVAGLSAGGAMAVILGRAYPDLFAAIGVHSGLPYRIAHDVPSAFAAMQRRTLSSPPRAAGDADSRTTVPTIVFHGDRDSTVHPGNGEQVAAETVGRSAGFPGGSGAAVEVRHGTAAGGRDYTQKIATDIDGRVLGEHWLVHGGGHAWSGGDATGTFTDPEGPDATAEMLRFFLEHGRRAPANAP